MFFVRLGRIVVRSVALCLISICLTLFVFVSCASATTRDVRTADELQQVLQQAWDDGITDIRITSSISGNFIVPSWVSSLSGTGAQVVLSPKDKDKPVFDAESSANVKKHVVRSFVRNLEMAVFWPVALVHEYMTKSTADMLTFQNMTIECDNKGINADALSKPVVVKNVTFKGRNGRNTAGIYPSTKTTFEGCTFEGLTWCINTRSVSAYDLEIRDCRFKNSSQALSVSRSGNGAKAELTRCRGEDVGYWVILHNPDDRMSVTVDQSTIDSCPRGGFYHKLLDGLKDNMVYGEDSEFSKIRKDVFDKKRAVEDLIKRLEAESPTPGVLQDWDSARTFAALKLREALKAENGWAPREEERSPEHKKAIDRCYAFYTLLAAAPLRSLSEDSIRGSLAFVSDKNLVNAVVSQLNNKNQLWMLGLLSSRIRWGNTGSVRSAFASQKIIDLNIDRIFRRNIDRLRDWLSDLDWAHKAIADLEQKARGSFPNDIQYLKGLQNAQRDVRELANSLGRAIRAIFFDVPMQTIFAAGYARTAEEADDKTGVFFKEVSLKGQTRIMQIAREIGPFYSVSQRLCVLQSTNSVREELLRLWKGTLAKERYDGDLKSYLSTDPDIMRDAKRIEDFFKEWR